MTPPCVRVLHARDLHSGGQKYGELYCPGYYKYRGLWVLQYYLGPFEICSPAVGPSVVLAFPWQLTSPSTHFTLTPTSEHHAYTTQFDTSLIDSHYRNYPALYKMHFYTQCMHGYTTAPGRENSEWGQCNGIKVFSPRLGGQYHCTSRRLALFIYSATKTDLRVFPPCTIIMRRSLTPFPLKSSLHMLPSLCATLV
ncbi:hypothetical protein C7212DRAFT_348312 [Tuber magnatum]|uniref:Uncharacterized protein n=1 Tax=Tuber magnatum TaxID=42249 RepID=A0A317SFD6_9PEZI|nr:hypothetical protein C7212DRAFT_348312 [Tuber magnatum]